MKQGSHQVSRYTHNGILEYTNLTLKWKEFMLTMKCNLVNMNSKKSKEICVAFLNDASFPKKEKKGVFRHKQNYYVRIR